MAVAAPESTLSAIQRVTGTQVSKMTINRRLRERNLRARRPLRCLPLTTVHRQVRLQWCREQSTWNCADWGRIVFSDESRFLLCPDDRRKRVWRRLGQRVNPGLTVEHHTGPQQGVMVWGAISFDSRTPLVVIPGTLRAQRYVDDILRPVLWPFLSRHPGLTFQQDNARPHTARVTMDCLQSFRTLPWPARSPDLSSIEHIWDVMGRRLQPSRKVDYLARQLETIWQEIPQHTIRNLYQSMTRRVAACIQATERTVKKWFARFKSGKFDLTDEERPGAPPKFEDIAHSVYYLFRSMQHGLADQHFSNYEVKKWIDEWIAAKEPVCLRDGIRQLLERFEKVPLQEYGGAVSVLMLECSKGFHVRNSLKLQAKKTFTKVCLDHGAMINESYTPIPHSKRS
ncbi:hypothetical protein LAZ67_2005502 [Cordylochernes scorpioides]|uniref:Transposase n=1 Tax=Cordylochernes scorpioides TaxID=51811 RepID=A0ABY6K634_9ARAC|nr:hypothetical protein LAZ67_2005502 [Cordylochernes scorpioides]